MSANNGNSLPISNSLPACLRAHEVGVSATGVPPQEGLVAESPTSPRLVTRGETSGTAANAIVDWLSVTLPDTSPVKMPALMPVIRDLLGVSDMVAKTQDRGIAGFEKSASLTINVDGTPADVGRIAWGGESQRGRTWLSFSGTLCARVTDWQAVALALVTWDARITRVDLAHDDFLGLIRLDEIQAMYLAGDFNNGGRRPTCSLAGDWLEVSGKGRTFYVGRRGNGKFLRIYEKGKQLGDANSPWVRWEVEFGSRDRVIPFHVLVDPDYFLAGAYPALQFVAPVHERIKTQRNIARTALDRLTELASLSYGKTVNALRLQGLDAEEILSLICRPGVPSRMASPIAAMPAGTHYFTGRDGND